MMEILIRIVCLVVGYAFGLIETGLLYSKARGVDLRKHGSGNVGTTNTLRTMGKRAGAIVLAGDMLKTFIPVLLAWVICHQFVPEMDYLVRLYTAAGVILGHDFPFYMKFKGGKGIACSAAMILAFYWGVLPGEAVIFFGIYLLTRYVSLASLFMYFGFLAQIIVFGQFGFLGMSQGMLIEVYIIIFILTLIAMFCHRENIKKLLKGEERRTYLKRSKNEEVAAAAAVATEEPETVSLDDEDLARILASDEDKDQEVKEKETDKITDKKTRYVPPETTTLVPREEVEREEAEKAARLAAEGVVQEAEPLSDIADRMSEVFQALHGEKEAVVEGNTILPAGYVKKENNTEGRE